MKTLNIIGAGKLGRTVGFLLCKNNICTIQNILNKTFESGICSRDFIGSGEVVKSFSNLLPADFYLLSVPDDQISFVCEQLILQHKIPKNSTIFHCSGALDSGQLLAAKKAGGFIASFHPAFSFGEPEAAANMLSGVMCAMEGDPEACDKLTEIFTQINVHIFKINKKNKLLYHAALVIASNYGLVLKAAALKILDKAEINKKTAMQILGLKKEPLEILTGPIIRGDYKLVAQETQALLNADKDLAFLYNILGKYTVKILQEKAKG